MAACRASKKGGDDMNNDIADHAVNWALIAAVIVVILAVCFGVPS